MTNTHPNLYAALQHIDAIASTGWLHQDGLSREGLVDLLAEIIDAVREALPAAHQAAAAPDMLEALRGVSRFMKTTKVVTRDEAERVYGAVDAAIAKAEG